MIYLYLYCISIYRSFQQNQNEIFDLSHLNEKMLQYVDPVTLNKLKDVDIKVLEEKFSFALNEMFSIGLKLTICLLLKWFCSIYVENNYIEEFFSINLHDECESFLELYGLIDDTKINSLFNKANKSGLHLKKIIFFVYLKIMSFPKTSLLQKAPISFNFIWNIINLLYDKHVVHHSHISGEIVGYAHGFCNTKVRENKNNINVIAYNLFGFDLFFFLKGVRLSVWKTANLAIGGSKLTNINYANIGEQVKFIDTMKYHQQSPTKLTESMTDEGKNKIKNESKNFIKKQKLFGNNFF